MNLEEERILLERCKSGNEAISLILNMESEVKHIVLIFLWQWWTARNKTNEGKKKWRLWLRSAALLLFTK
jgi:hypothetical protein